MNSRDYININIPFCSEFGTKQEEVSIPYDDVAGIGSFPSVTKEGCEAVSSKIKHFQINRPG